MKRLQDKVAIVTGGGTGLGREISLLYAEEGAKVIVCDVRANEGEHTVEGIRQAGGESTFVETDVAQSSDVMRAVALAESTYGGLHIMTANAGILGRGTGKSLAEIDESEIAEIMNVNWLGVCLSFKYAIPAIRRAGGGAMTATGSVAAHRGRPGLPIYCASKGAIGALVRSLALDLAPEIRVNMVSAGAMSTEIRAHAAQAQNRSVDELSATMWKGEGPVGRTSNPREVAYAHLFLASDEASYVNGQALIVDGGKSVASL